MSLLDVPCAVWQSLLFNWVSLPELIRFDFAVSSNTTAVVQMLPFIIKNRSMPHCVELKRRQMHLDKLLLWMKARKVYLTCISKRFATDPEWGPILKWTGCTIRRLSLSHLRAPHALLHCTILEHLSVENMLTNAQTLQTILRSYVTIPPRRDITDHKRSTFRASNFADNGPELYLLR